MDGVGKTVGILGGGQLGRMLALAARPLGIKTIVVDPSVNCPAGVAADEHIVGSFTDAAVIAQLAKKCDVVTIEIEHVNAASLAVVSESVAVEPAPSTVALMQDKYEQKLKLAGAGVKCGPFRTVSSAADVSALGAGEFGYPIMLKSRRLAYDGRGNAVVRSEADIPAAWGALAPKGDLYAEKWVPFARELAVVVVRDRAGGVVAYPAVQTVQRESICHLVLAPAPVPGDVRTAAEQLALQAASHLAGAGVFGVELFELHDGSVLLNEIAPRVHNSGHFTIEGCVTSQFENHVRAVLGLPLGSTAMRAPAAAMINVLGAAPTDADIAAAGGDVEAAALAATWAPMKRALSVPGANLHWYDKHVPSDGSTGAVSIKAGRKLGHITVTGDSSMAVSAKVQAILAVDAATAQGDDATALKALTTQAPLVGIIMGSDSDLPGMAAAAETLRDFGVPFELTIVSAHRTPTRMYEYAQSARRRGLQIIIAAAGGAAHLPGMVAALTPLPVIGVPMPLHYLDGQDSLYSIVQMPRGVPVATVAIGNSTNAALLAVRMLGSHMAHLADAMEAFQVRQEREVMGKVQSIAEQGWDGYLKAKAAAAGSK